MRIINPAFGPQHEPGQTTSAANTAIDWTQDAIAVVSNAKPNARELLEGLKDALRAFRPVDNVDYHYKDSAAQPAPDALIEHIAGRYKIAILALAD